MSISRRNNRALNRVLRDSLRARSHSEPPPDEAAKTDAPAYTLSTDIPDSYNDSYVKAIPKDPRNTFVYWELPKGRADGSLFADRGTAHVDNGEAVRIGEQLSESQRQRQADSRRYADGGYHQDNRLQTDWDNGNQYGVDDYRQAISTPHNDRWDNRNQYNFDGGSQQHHHGVDDYHQADWDNGNQYRQDDGRQHNRRVDNHYIWNDGNHYSFDGGNQQHHRNVDDYHQVNNGYHQINWDNGDQYRRDDAYRHLRRLQDGIYRLHWNDGGDYAARRDDGAAFSDMLEALIARCNRHIADYSQGGSAPLARALSSGLLRDAGEEPRT